MSIPNVSTLFQRLRRGAEGGLEFARIIDQLLVADGQENGYPFQAFDDARGDAFGVDAFAKEGFRHSDQHVGYQYKFYGSPLSESARASIKRSLKKASVQFPTLGTWILVTPEDLTKPDIEWFHSLGDSFEWVSNHVPMMLHWGHKRVLDLMLRYPHIGKQYYPELFSSRQGAVSIVSIRMDSDECDWCRHLFTDHIQHTHKPAFMSFVELNNYLVRFDKIEPMAAKMFEDVLHVLQERLRSAATPPSVASDELEYFLRMDVQTFYKSVVLLNRLRPSTTGSLIGLPQHLENLGDTYDPRINDDVFGDKYSGDFYRYDVRAIRVVGAVLPVVWPEGRFVGVAEDALTGESFRLFKRAFMRTTDPLFDIALLNNTSETEILHRIDIDIRRIWSEKKAGPVAHTLRSIATYSFRLDFEKRLNSFELEPPLSFGSEQPIRFKVRFEDFIRSCPANNAKIAFSFICNQRAIESEELLLDF